MPSSLRAGAALLLPPLVGRRGGHGIEAALGRQGSVVFELLSIVAARLGQRHATPYDAAAEWAAAGDS
jgi:hypothetical protein